MSEFANITCNVNGDAHTLKVNPLQSLAVTLRDTLGLTGTKLGCEAGDCGACTVLLDQKQVCACLVPTGQCNGVAVTTVEGHEGDPVLAQLQQSFLSEGAAQCGICTPGMLLSAADLLHRTTEPDRGAVQDAIGGTLCRCTGYIPIINAVLHAAQALSQPLSQPPADGVTPAAPKQETDKPGVTLVGSRVQRIDGIAKVQGTERYGADYAPVDSLWLRVVRSPHAHATFTLGDFSSLHARYPGLEKVLTARDVPGHNGFGIYPHIKEQPVLADGLVRYRGEAVLALVGTQDTVDQITWSELPLSWQPLPAMQLPEEALRDNAAQMHTGRDNNVLIKGYVEKGELPENPESQAAFASGHFETAFVEHAYIEPEAGYARRVGDRIEVYASTQAPTMDLEEVANVLGVAHDAVRIIPSGCGGGFGGKLDVSVQPLLAVAAWVLDRPVRTVFNRTESMASSTKRHPASIDVWASANCAGILQAFNLKGDFNTGAYASWGPTVAGRVPVHCTGPYRVDNVRCTTRAIHTHLPSSGAFRGFGTPQAAFAQELVYDQLADQLGIDRWQFRRDNAFRTGDTTPSGQRLDASVGMVECLDALESGWQDQLQACEQFNKENTALKRGVGIACMWYGCGNTALSNPSTLRVALKANGRVVFYNGAVDIGQGSSTVLLQICADAVGLPLSCFDCVNGDTDLTDDAGKTSASRQTFVSGKAAMLAGLDLREKLLALVGANADAQLSIDNGELRAQLDYTNLSYALPQGEGKNTIAEGVGTFDPPITALDEKGQGQAYATYAFAAQICSVEVDTRLGTVKPLKVIAAHDVGRAINPQLIEGQIYGGIAQGLGMALMEEYIPGVTENLHDYLIPTAGDMPDIDVKLVEAPEPLGPYGAKGVGEPALVPTPAAIVAAIRHATGVLINRLPVLPHRLLEALHERRDGAD